MINKLKVLVMAYFCRDMLLFVKLGAEISKTPMQFD